MSRIDSGTILIAFFAILFGLVGAFILRKSLQPKEQGQVVEAKVERRPAKLKVPLASRNLKAGTQITLDDVALFSLTRDEMKEHDIKRIFMSNPDQIIGKTLAVDLERGETFDTKNFYPPGMGPGIIDRLEPGQRAVTIDVSATNALIGFAGAGQNVDVLFHFGEEPRFYNRFNDRDRDLANRNAQGPWTPDHWGYNAPTNVSDYDATHGAYQRRRIGNSFQSATVTLVQDATILALGQRVAETADSSRLQSDERVHITLAVTPDSAELLRVAQGHGELSLTLRGKGDNEVVKDRTPKTLDQIIPTKERGVAAPVQRTIRDLDIYRGKQRTRVRFSQAKDTGTDSFQRWAMETVEFPGTANGQSARVEYQPLTPDQQAQRSQTGSGTRTPVSFRRKPTLFNPHPEDDLDALPRNRRTEIRFPQRRDDRSLQSQQDDSYQQNRRGGNPLNQNRPSSGADQSPPPDFDSASSRPPDRRSAELLEFTDPRY